MNRPTRIPSGSGILLLTGLVLLAIVPALTPFVGEGLRASLMQGFSMVCHQIPGRSPHSHGVQWAICHRDLGIYWGLPAGALAYIVTGWAPSWMNRGIPFLFAAALVPLGLDWGLDAFGVLANSAPSRIATGAVFGITSGFILAWTVLTDRSVK
ncbi:MAG: DUF2085 domain-containing protein [Rhodothermales bacterium]